MQDKEIKDYIFSQSEIEAPALQKALSLSYGEAKSVIADLEKDGKLQFKSGVVYEVIQPNSSGGNRVPYKPLSEYEAKCISALWVCIKAGEANAALIQRKCLTGYAMAVSIVHWLEVNKYISPYPIRKILISEAEYIDKFGNPEAPAEDDDNGDNNNADDDGNDIDAEIDKFISNLDSDGELDVPDVKSVLADNVARCVNMRSSGKYVLELTDRLKFVFEYMHETKVMRISDDATTFMRLSLSVRRIKNALKKFPQVQYDKGQVFIDVPKPNETFTAVLTLYAAVDYLYKLD